MASNPVDDQPVVTVAGLPAGPARVEGRNIGTFVHSHLPRPRCRLLEVGGPPYAAAHWLAVKGHEVDVVDPTGGAQGEQPELDIVPSVVVPNAVELKTRAYDGALVSNVLHVFHDLEEILSAIAKSVVSGGLLVLEEPDAEELAGGASDWYRMALDELRGRRYIELSTDDDLERAVFADRSIAEYFEQRGHALHGRLALRGAVRANFNIISESGCPYLYRYFARVAPSGESGERLTESFFRLETDAIQKGLLNPLGRRFVLASG